MARSRQAARSDADPRHALPTEWIDALRGALLAWYDRHKRALPWRETRDPYAIWISETMLQQTRVETVVPYWQRFLERFPDVRSLAEASQEDVYAAWTGLGYYSRARNLQAAARQIVDEHAGQLPEDTAALRGLSGIGPYTAGAVASIAFDRPAAIVDGNVVRVLSRLRGLREDVGRKPVMDRIWAWSETLVSAGARPGDFNQAMMELGATICLPKAPLCLACPVREPCAAAAAGDADSIPKKSGRKKAQEITGVAVWIERRGRVLVVQRPDRGLMANLWELPGGLVDVASPAAGAVVDCVERSTGLRVSGLAVQGQVTHLFTHRRLTLHVHRAKQATGRVRLEGPQAHRWLPRSALADLPQAGPMRKALALLGEGPEESPRARLRATRAAPRSAPP